MKAVGYKKSLPIDAADALIDFEAPKPEPTGREIRVAVKAVSVKHETYRVSGVVTEGGTPAAGVSVQLFRGGSAGALARATSARTDANGAFSFTGAFGKAKLLFFQAKASAGERAGACTSPLPTAPAGCVGATLSPWAAWSTVAKAKR